jgi:uncharacterized protein YecT (DUF1311 family)
MRPYFLLTWLLIMFFSCPIRSFSQDVSLVPSAQQLQIRQETDPLMETKRKELLSEQLDSTEINFTLDTSRIELYFDKCWDYVHEHGLTLTDADRAGMDYAKAKAYDSLLNKYYKHLFRLLNEMDKKILVQAQRSWLAYRDNEDKLRESVGMAATGGGSLLQLDLSGAYLTMVENRTIDLYHYYSRVMNHM